MILGMLMLRTYAFLRKKNEKQNIYDQYRRQTLTPQNSDAIPGGTEQVMTSYLRTKNEFDRSDTTLTDPIDAKNIAYTPHSSRKHQAEQIDVELLTLSRQIKAEIDTKIVALQLMIADADRVLRNLERHVPPGAKNVPESMPRYIEPDRMKIIRQEETVIEEQSSFLPPPRNDFVDARSSARGMENNDLTHLNNIVVEDPFVENDFGFNKAMFELDQLSSGIPGLDPIRPVDRAESRYDMTGDGDREPLSDWETPMSYPIGDYRADSGKRDQNPVSSPRQSNFEPLSNHLSHDLLADRPDQDVRRRTSYTNKLLTQPPPQLDSLMTNETVRKMGSKPYRAASAHDSADDSHDEEPLVPPMIPKMPPPSAQTILVESAPYSQAKNELDKIAVRKAKRHQLQYLIEKGMSPKEIAAHLEMPVGEVELILSLHKRLSGETGKTAKEPLTDSPIVSKRIIPAEHVVVENETAPEQRRFHVVTGSDDDFNEPDDGEQVA